jgi:hypothetical protein
MLHILKVKIETSVYSCFISTFLQYLCNELGYYYHHFCCYYYYHCYYYLGEVGLSPLVQGLSWAYCANSRMIDEYGILAQYIWRGETEVLGGKPPPVPLRVPNVSYTLPSC